MTIKARGRGSNPEVHDWTGGFTWIAHPDERMRRASHAIEADDGRDPPVWVVDPVDADGLDDRLGRVEGVVVLSSYHRRDAAAIATRHDASVYLPEHLVPLAADVDARVEVFDNRLPGTTFHAVPAYRGVPWREAFLHDPETGTLVATESLSTTPDLTGPDERLAVSPFVRFRPPRAALEGLKVDRILVGHGDPVLEEAGRHLSLALGGAVRGAPEVWIRNLPYLLRAAVVASRE